MKPLMAAYGTERGLSFLYVLPQTLNRNRRPTCYVSICATAAAVASSDSEIPLPINSLS